MSGFSSENPRNHLLQTIDREFFLLHWEANPHFPNHPPDTTSPMEQLIELKVANKMGLHARPAAMIVRVANKYSAEGTVEKDDEQVNGKSIMGLMMLAAPKGTSVTIETSGPEAEKLAVTLEDLVNNLFGEGK